MAQIAHILKRTSVGLPALLAFLVSLPASAQELQLPLDNAPTAHRRPATNRRHSPYIQHVLGAQYKVEVKHQRSQLIVANRKISRIAITSPEIVNFVQYSPTEVSLIGLQPGRTDLTMWFQDDPNPAIYEVSVIPDQNIQRQRQLDVGNLEKKLALLFPNSRVYLIPISKQVIVKGQAHDSEEAARILQIVRAEVGGPLSGGGVIQQAGGVGGNVLAGYGPNGTNANNGGVAQAGFTNDRVVNMLKVPGEFQVMLRVRIAELNRSQLRRLGIDLRSILNNGRHALSSTMGGALANLSGVFENGELGVMLNWLQSNGTISFLAEPALTVMSGHPASFLSGGEFAVPTIIGLGGGQNTQFRGYGTSLIVTPTVLDKDLVRLQIVPEFSQLDQTNSVNGIPGTNVRRVQTVVELREGQTIAIGGLISRKTSTEVSRIPLIGDIPYFGSRLFSAKRATEDESELLIIVTPEIVRPMDSDEVPPLPNHYVTHPNDRELYHEGRTEGNPNRGAYHVPPYGSGSNSQAVDLGYNLFGSGMSVPADVVPQMGIQSGITPQVNGSLLLAPQVQGGFTVPPGCAVPSAPAPLTQAPIRPPSQQRQMPLPAPSSTNWSNQYTVPDTSLPAPYPQGNVQAPVTRPVESKPQGDRIPAPTRVPGFNTPRRIDTAPLPVPAPATSKGPGSIEPALPVITPTKPKAATGSTSPRKSLLETGHTSALRKKDGR